MDSLAHTIALSVRGHLVGFAERADAGPIRLMHEGLGNEAAYFTLDTPNGERYVVHVERRATAAEPVSPRGQHFSDGDYGKFPGYH